MKKFLLLFIALTYFAFPFSSKAVSLPDVVGHPYETAIRYLESEGIVQGYPDGLYRPEKEVNRAEFTKIVFGLVDDTRPLFDLDRNCFPDVRFEDWFSVPVCYALTWGIINGYPDGFFRPENNINLSEAAKILVNALNVEKPSVSQSAPWNQVYIQALQAHHYIPSSFTALNQPVNRGQLAEMVYRIQNNVTDQPFSEFSSENTASQNEVCLSDYDPENIDMQVVRTAWLDWHNQERAERGISPLTDSLSLDYSASVWAQSNKESGEITHDRAVGQTLSDWFQSTGLSVQGAAGENLGSGTYSCQQTDCTQALTNAVKGIFELFMDEEGTAYTGHYDNVIGSQYSELGFGLAVDEATQTFYVASHYAGNGEFDSEVIACE